MDENCDKEPPPELGRAIEQFNAGEYYECHETLEDLWRGEPGTIRNLYKGILQIGIAIHHAKRANLKGALRLLSSGLELTERFAPRCLGVDTALLLETATGIREKLERLDPGQCLPPGYTPEIKLSR
jgi:predicted metal-dependent hydrolase